MTILTVNCLIIVLLIVYLHYTHKLTTAKAALLAYATQVFNIEFAGPTITTLFCVTSYFLVADLAGIALRKQDAYITKKGAMIVIMPIIAFILSENYFLQHHGIMERAYGTPRYTAFSFFYLKNYLLFLIVIARKVSLESSDTIEDLLSFCEKIAFFSCFLAIFQIFLHAFLSEGSQLSLFFGNKPGFVYNLLNIPFTRPSAFFNEPKEFAGFLGLMLPYALLKKKKGEALLFCLIGILTVSTTFFVVAFLSFLFFVIFNVLNSYRVKILGSIATLLLLAVAVMNAGQYLVNTLGGKQEKVLYQLVTNRLVDRVNKSFAGADTRVDFYGIPLQPDLELPVVNFMRDYPVVFLLGHGPGGARFIPIEYFKGTWAYDAKVEGRFLGHMNMGWLNYFAEFGIVLSLLLFMAVSKFDKTKLFTALEKKYVAFILAALFFYRVDVVFVIFYGVVNARNSRSVTAEHKGI